MASKIKIFLPLCTYGARIEIDGTELRCVQSITLRARAGDTSLSLQLIGDVEIESEGGVADADCIAKFGNVGLKVDLPPMVPDAAELSVPLKDGKPIPVSLRGEPKK